MFIGSNLSDFFTKSFWKELNYPDDPGEIFGFLFIYLFIYLIIYLLSYLNKKIFYTIISIPLIMIVLSIIEQLFFI